MDSCGHQLDLCGHLVAASCWPVVKHIIVVHAFHALEARGSSLYEDSDLAIIWHI